MGSESISPTSREQSLRAATARAMPARHFDPNEAHMYRYFHNHKHNWSAGQPAQALKNIAFCQAIVAAHTSARCSLTQGCPVNPSKAYASFVFMITLIACQLLACL